MALRTAASRAIELARVAKAKVSDLLFGTATGDGVALALAHDGSWTNGPSIDVSEAASYRVYVVSYTPADEAGVEIQAQISEDDGTHWVPLSELDAASGGNRKMKNYPIRLDPSGTNSIGADTAGSLLFGLSADTKFRIRARQITPGASDPTLLVRGRMGLPT